MTMEVHKFTSRRALPLRSFREPSFDSGCLGKTEFHASFCAASPYFFPPAKKSFSLRRTAILCECPALEILKSAKCRY